MQNKIEQNCDRGNIGDIMTSDLSIRQEKGKIWSHIRQKWLIETPEEFVRQKYLTILVNEYGYDLKQIEEEESVTGRGAGQARADFVIWRTIQDKINKKTPLIIVECKSDTITIRQEDYHQGDHYARMANAPFFVTHNTRETRYWRVRKDLMPGHIEEIENIPHADANDREIDELISKLKTFREDEFADLLHQCHNVIRNREHLDPAAAFDEIAKVLFVKTWVERELRNKQQRQNLFTAEWLDSQLGENPLNDLFLKTKDAFKKDRIFSDTERINLKSATGREIVRLLERYNLSDTSEDVKGIAFERFLGKTFRGEIGQFFTPRTIVEFMVRMVEPKENDIVCDPASGSGGFLIRFFEIVREQILADVNRQYQSYFKEIQDQNLSAEKRAELLRKKHEELQTTIKQTKTNSRLWKLANRCIYGCDANERMARTSKMNMIMHGDGHGGVHHHNGFINVNGIFEGRFDIILTNPPFGANIEPSDRITLSDVKTTEEQYNLYKEWYGEPYEEAQAKVQAAAEVQAPIASLFDLPKRGSSQKKTVNKVKTEILFIERCLTLLKPGGRLGIVLPEGIFNNPSSDYIRVREFCEDRAYIMAIISLPKDTFVSTGTTVKASLLFLQKFTEQESADFEAKRQTAINEVEAELDNEFQERCLLLKQEIATAKKAKSLENKKDLMIKLRQLEKDLNDKKVKKSRLLLKKQFKYPIFLYDAEHVGINATGEEDTCELFYVKKLGLPKGISQDETAIEHYWKFRKDPEPYMLKIRSNGDE